MKSYTELTLARSVLLFPQQINSMELLDETKLLQGKTKKKTKQLKFEEPKIK